MTNRTSKNQSGHTRLRATQKTRDWTDRRRPTTVRQQVWALIREKCYMLPTKMHIRNASLTPGVVHADPQEGRHADARRPSRVRHAKNDARMALAYTEQTSQGW